MRISDLVTRPDLGVDVEYAGSDKALRRPIMWCAATESIDPSPFLTPGALVVTCGMALNVTDVRIWDAYVERLANVPVAAVAFGLGAAHRTLPEGLAIACRNHGVPLLVIPEQVPFVLVQRDVQDQLSAERYAVLRQGSELAEECTRLAANDGTLHDVLHRISQVLGVRVSIQDSTGLTLLSAGPDTPGAARTEFTMPGSERDRFRLVVEEHEARPLMRTLLAPVAAVVTMHLSNALGSGAVAHSRNAGRLTETIYANAAVPTEELVALTRDAEIEPYDRIGVVVIRAEPTMTTTYLRTVSWRARVKLGGEYPIMRYVEDPDLSTILVQGGSLDIEKLTKSADSAIAPTQAVSVVVSLAENATELGLTLRLARRALGVRGVHAAPALNFDAVIDTVRHPGTISLSRRLLRPLTESEDTSLLATLEAYLRLSGATPAICRELYIHRNTLAYRLRRIEEALGMDLRDGQVRATLLMATRLSRAEQ